MKQLALILLIWLLSASTVSAGCAWILWEGQYSPYKQDRNLLTFQMSTPVSSWESKGACWKDLMKRINANPKRKGIPERDGDHVYMDLDNGELLKLQCAPDSVDLKVGAPGIWRKSEKP